MLYIPAPQTYLEIKNKICQFDKGIGVAVLNSDNDLKVRSNG